MRCLPSDSAAHSLHIGCPYIGVNSAGSWAPAEEQKAANDALVSALETHPTIEAVVLTNTPSTVNGGFYKSKSDAEVVAAVQAHAQRRRLATCLLIVDFCG